MQGPFLGKHHTQLPPDKEKRYQQLPYWRAETLISDVYEMFSGASLYESVRAVAPFFMLSTACIALKLTSKILQPDDFLGDCTAESTCQQHPCCHPCLAPS